MKKQPPRVPKSMADLRRVKIDLTGLDVFFRTQGMQYAKRLGREQVGVELEFVTNVGDCYYFVENTSRGKKYIEWYFKSLEDQDQKQLFK